METMHGCGARTLDGGRHNDGASALLGLLPPAHGHGNAAGVVHLAGEAVQGCDRMRAGTGPAGRVRRMVVLDVIIGQSPRRVGHHPLTRSGGSKEARKA